MNVYTRFDYNETLKKKQNVTDGRAHRRTDILKAQFAGGGGGINIEMKITHANILEFRLEAVSRTLFKKLVLINLQNRQGFRPGTTKTGLRNLRRLLEV